MANTYTQIHIHAVFAVKYRQALIHKSWKDELFKYITAIVQEKEHKMLIINGVEDHVHMLFGFRPTQSLSELMYNVKSFSSGWINKKGFLPVKFNWQNGYGAFSYAKSDLKNVIRYIENQEEHHRKESLKKEYIKLLDKFEVDYDEKYIFDKVYY